MIYRTVVSLLLVSIAFQMTLADPITYRQVGQVQGTRALNALPLPPTNNAGVWPLTRTRPKQEQQGPRAQESPNHPEFVRLSDGRLVKYGPGVVCDEGCVEAVPLGKMQVARSWYVLPPILAVGALCAALCRGGENLGALAQPGETVVVIQPSPSPTLTMTPTPPPAEIPEPGTLALLGIGLGALVARKRLNGKKDQAQS